MKWFTYIKYFSFLYSNWSFAISYFIFRHEIRGEKKYGIDTTGFDALADVRKKGIDTSHSTFYMPANYYMLETLLAEAKRYPHNNTFLDIGCGRGRALSVAAFYGFRRLIGIDFSPSFCTQSKKNLARVAQQVPGIHYTIEQVDAAEYPIPDEVTVIFLFNPFDALITTTVVGHIRESHQRNPRNIRVLYVNPLHKDLFLYAGFTELFSHTKLDFLMGSILELAEKTQRTG